MEKDNITVRFESFEEIEERQKERLENIQDWNNAMSGTGTGYETTLAEELGTNSLPYMGIVHGKRIIFKS